MVRALFAMFLVALVIFGLIEEDLQVCLSNSDYVRTGFFGPPFSLMPFVFLRVEIVSPIDLLGFHRKGARKVHSHLLCPQPCRTRDASCY